MKSVLKNRAILDLYDKLFKNYCSIIALVSPALNLKARYRRRFGREINLDHPQTLVEKLAWLLVNRYADDPVVIQCADKYAVREYVRQRGCGETLNELYGVYDRVEEIPWEELPDAFVLKWNFGSTYNMLCPDKSKLDIERAKRQLRKWGKSRYWLKFAEMHYRHIPKRILCEKYLADDEEGEIPDYKVYCFHGIPRAILILRDRNAGMKGEFFDADWLPLKGPRFYAPPSVPTRRPDSLEQLLETARKLSSGIPFVRCDFYMIGQKVVFGEMTFTPGAVVYMSETSIHGKDMSEFLHLDGMADLG